jgi:hypothetical protein
MAAMIRLPLTAAAALLALATACGERRPAELAPPPPAPVPDAAPRAPARRLGRLWLDCKPDHATVIVDTAPRGSVREIATRGGLVLSLGVHRLEVRARGYRTYRLELNIVERPEHLVVQLQPAE